DYKVTGVQTCALPISLSPSLEGSPHTPRFIHDCDHCKFLGQYFSDDLYFCDYGPATVIARFGNDGHEYSSGLGSTLPNLQEAERSEERRVGKSGEHRR